MKKKFKIINLLIVIGFAMGCSDQSETENLREFSTVTKNEAIQFLSSRNFKNPNNYIKNVDIDALKSELIANSDQELLVVPVETSDEGYDSRLVMLKIKNEVKAKVVHYLKKDLKTSDFTGEVIFSDLEGGLSLLIFPVILKMKRPFRLIFIFCGLGALSSSFLDEVIQLDYFAVAFLGSPLITAWIKKGDMLKKRQE